MPAFADIFRILPPSGDTFILIYHFIIIFMCKRKKIPAFTGGERECLLYFKTPCNRSFVCFLREFNGKDTILVLRADSFCIDIADIEAPLI